MMAPPPPPNSPKSIPIKAAVNNHIAQCQLSEKQLHHLLTMGTQPAASAVYTSAIYRGRRRTYLQAVTLAACFAFAMFIGFLVGQAPSPTEYLDRAIEETVHNHLLQMPLEVKAGTVEQLKSYFHRLDFAPVDTALFSPSLDLLGGRYCSIQGQAAAQLRYGTQATQDGAITVFQVPLDKRLQNHLPVKRIIDGVQVEVMSLGELMVVRVMDTTSR